MPLCAVKVEVAFNAGFRTPLADADFEDVSDRVFGQATVTWGRADQFSPPEPLGCSVVLANEDGALTPRNASSPYFPNVKLDRIVRLTVTPEGGSDSVRFTGYADGYPRTWPGGTDLGSVYVNLTASSRTSRLGDRNALYSDLIEYSIASGAIAVFPLDEPEGAKQGLSLVSDHTLTYAGSGTPGQFTGGAARLRGGKHLTSLLTLGSDYSIALSFFSTSRGGRGILPAQLQQDYATLGRANDGMWHRLVMTETGGNTTGFDLYLDGKAIPFAVTAVRTSNLILGRLNPSAFIKDVVVYDSKISAGDVTEDFDAFNGGYGDRTDVRLERYATFAAIPPAEVNADAGAVPMGATDIAGMSTLDAFRVCETTEGGWLTDDRDGSLRLLGRSTRYYTPPTLTLDMEAEDVGADYSPTLDKSNLRNDVTGTNAATNMGQLGDGSGVSFTVRDEDSVAEYGVVGASVEVNAVDDSEAKAAASWIVANWSEPADRLPNVTVDLLPLDASQAADALAVFLGDRIELTNRTAQDANSTEQFFAESGSETWGADTAEISFGVSPIAQYDNVLRFDTDSFDSGKIFAR